MHVHIKYSYYSAENMLKILTGELFTAQSKSLGLSLLLLIAIIHMEVINENCYILLICKVIYRRRIRKKKLYLFFC